MKQMLREFINLHYVCHLVTALILRFTLIGYSIYHDAVYELPYTDIDYKVFTDASRHVLNGESPYERHTYRYSPLLAYILIPNVTFMSIFGKVLFSIVDILVALLIREIVLHSLNRFAKKTEINKPCIETNKKFLTNSKEFKPKHRSRRSKRPIVVNKMEPYDSNFPANLSILIWLYNPLTVAIATRGSCDSIAGFLVLLTIYCVQCKNRYFIGGLVHGLSIHFRLYPIFYSLTLFLHLSKYSYYISKNPKKNSDKSLVTKQVNEKRTIFKKKYLFYLIPNKQQIALVLGCLMSLGSLIGIFYHLYGYKFIYETYLYHFIRKDTRHNFSLYFYLQYLSAYIRNVPIWQSVLMSLPQIVLLVVLSVKYGLEKCSLNFGLFIQTIVIVSYNTVLTSQYFVWIMVVLPLCIWQIKIPIRNIVVWIIVWFVAQGAWLLPAYLLEFRGENTFKFIWLQGIAFFSANIAILGRLIMHYKPCGYMSIKSL